MEIMKLNVLQYLGSTGTENWPTRRDEGKH